MNRYSYIQTRPPTAKLKFRWERATWDPTLMYCDVSEVPLRIAFSNHARAEWIAQFETAHGPWGEIGRSDNIEEAQAMCEKFYELKYG